MSDVQTRSYSVLHRPYLYRLVVDHLWERPSTVNEVFTLAQSKLSAAPSRSTVHATLRAWVDAGCLALIEGKRGPANRGQSRHIYRTMPQAFTPKGMTAALGFKGAALVPDAEASVVTAEPSVGLAVPDDASEAQPAVWREPVPLSERLGLTLPENLWQATMTPKGVLITFGDYQRVLSLLAAITGEQG